MAENPVHRGGFNAGRNRLRPSVVLNSLTTGTRKGGLNKIQEQESQRKEKTSPREKLPGIRPERELRRAGKFLLTTSIGMW